MDPLHKNSSPQQTTELKATELKGAAQKTSGVKKYWLKFTAEIKNVRKSLGKYLSFQSLHGKAIFKYRVSIPESVEPRVNQRFVQLNQILNETKGLVETRWPNLLAMDSPYQDVASALMVMNGLAEYQNPAGLIRHDFSIKPIKKQISEADVNRMQAVMESIDPLRNMEWKDIHEILQNDAVVVPRKMGVLRGVGKIISGTTKTVQKSSGAETEFDFESQFKNPGSVYVVVYEDKVPGHPGHAALLIRGKGKAVDKTKYVSHLGAVRTRSDMVKMVIPKVKVESVMNSFEDDCKQFGNPDFIVELKNLDRDEMLLQLNSVKSKGYDLASRNCSTAVGELLLAGVEPDKSKNIRRPSGFWTPYDVTGMARDLWTRENIKAK